MLVSIGLPFANNRSTIELAVRSIFAQTHTDWELILIDDGSNDGSADFVASIKDSRVTLVRDPQNLGLAVRLNQIARLASGTYLARMDADDAMHPDRIRRQLEMLMSQTQLDFISSAAYVMNSEARVTGIKSTELPPTHANAALDHDCWVHPTAFGRTQWFLDNPYEEHLRRSQDYELWARVYESSHFSKITEPLLFYRESGVFNLENYLTTKRIDEGIIRKYAPPLIGEFRTEILVTKTRLKAIVYRVLCALHLEEFLVKKRSVPLSEPERVRAEAVLARVWEAPVPGWVMNS